LLSPIRWKNKKAKKVVDTISYLAKMAAHFERKPERLKSNSLLTDEVAL
jgi:hypothetical protein